MSTSFESATLDCSSIYFRDRCTWGQVSVHAVAAPERLADVEALFPARQELPSDEVPVGATRCARAVDTTKSTIPNA